MNNHHFTSSRQSSVDPTVISNRNELLLGAYAAIDTEYKFNQSHGSKAKPYTIFSVAIVDSLGNVKVKHESDFWNHQFPEKALVQWALSGILQYRLTIGWYTKGVRIQNEDGTFTGTDSDLKIIDDACRYYKIPSVIGFDKRGIPYVRGYHYSLCDTDSYYARLNKFDRYYHIDLYQVYKKPMVKTSIYQSRYKDLSLGSVSKAILNEDKFEDLDGLRIQSLSKEKQLQYVIQDASLVMKLSQHNNYEILDLMNAISTITNIPFEKVCHTGISTWWNNIILEKLTTGECRFPTSKLEKKAYKGGLVIEPATGYYNNQDVYVLDVKSLYPTMMINNNISFDTVNCPCCPYPQRPEAVVSTEIMNLINDQLPEDQKRQPYWICKDASYKGIIPRLLTQYRKERFRHQEIGNNPIQLALKNLINGIYGLFGSRFFDYSDYRVAELTTAFGRQTLEYMQHIAKEVYGFTIIYGDTDSIFVTNLRNQNDINKFLAECSIVLEDVDIEVSKLYKKTLITKKKHYIGIPKDPSQSPDIKGFEAIKSDRPLWINLLQKGLVEDIKNDINPTIVLKKAYIDMERGSVPADLLVVKSVLTKDPSQYSHNSYQRVVGTSLGAKEGDAIKYYKSNTRGKAHFNPSFLSRSKYLEMMKNTFEEQLMTLGYDFMKDVVGMTSLADLI